MVTHLDHQQDMDQVDRHDMMGTHIWKDRKSEVMMSPLKSTLAILYREELTRQKKNQLWHVHLSWAAATKGGCGWARCPKIKKVRQKENVPTTCSCGARSSRQMQDATSETQIPPTAHRNHNYYSTVISYWSVTIKSYRLNMFI